MQNGNQASAHLENKETNSAAENGIMSPPTGERGVVPGPAAGVSEASLAQDAPQPWESSVKRQQVQPVTPRMERKFDRVDIRMTVGSVTVYKNPTTRIVETVLGWELVVALCEISKERASGALSYVLSANRHLSKVFFYKSFKYISFLIIIF